MKEFLFNPTMLSIYLFFVLQLINVVMSTTRTILTVRASRNIAVLINTVSYTFYTGIVKLISGQSLMAVIIVTFVTNLIGVYFALWLVDRGKKDKLWIIEVTAPTNTALEIGEELYKEKIGYIQIEVKNDIDSLRIYSYNQQQSLSIKKILANYQNVHYAITETKGQL